MYTLFTVFDNPPFVLVLEKGKTCSGCRFLRRGERWLNDRAWWLSLALVRPRLAGARSRTASWAAADALRERIAALGWLVTDTPTGPSLEPLSEKPG